MKLRLRALKLPRKGSFKEKQPSRFGEGCFLGLRPTGIRR